jgi:hypothetical protein
MAYDYLKLAKAKTWNEKELNAFKNKINSSTEASKTLLKALNTNSAIYNATGIKLDAAQTAKGFKYLKNLGFTPTGKVRSNSPLRERESWIVLNPKSIVLLGFYQPGRSNFVVPLYEAYGGKKGEMRSMEYYVSGGKISIVG